MIQHYPNAAQMSDFQRPEPPAAVLRAVRVMYAGAVVCAIQAITCVLTAGAWRTAVEQKYPHLGAHGVTVITHTAVIAAAGTAVIGAVLFIRIARSCRKGRNWARVGRTVLFAIAVLGAVYDFSTAHTTLNLMFVFAGCLIDLVAVVLLWQGSSSAYFRFFKRPQF